MPLRTETQNLLLEIERSSDRTLNFRDEVGLLLEVALRHRTLEVFNEAIFLSKFITKSIGVMKRIGSESEGYDKLASEFGANVQKATALLRRIVDLAPVEDKRTMAPFFLSLTQDSLEHLMLLMVDLTIVKNWILDGHKFPEEPAA